MNKVSYGAWGATVIWVGIIGWVAFARRAEFAGMAPNAIGDFLAGTVSPLALIWLVAGYLQQGKELQQNTQALLLQQIEMQNQVKEFKKLAQHAEEQAIVSVAMLNITKAERAAQAKAEIAAAQPLFVFENTGITKTGDLMFSFKNMGKSARNISMTSNAFLDCSFASGSDLVSEAYDHIQFSNFNDEGEMFNFIVDVKYEDINGDERVQRYEIRNGMSYLQAGRLSSDELDYCEVIEN